VNELGEFVHREARLQDPKNRQNSMQLNLRENDDDRRIAYQWEQLQSNIMKKAEECYDYALSLGIAKEQARAILPEGLTMSRMYMNGNIRSWIFYLKQRLDPSTQLEHRVIAQQILHDLRFIAPVTIEAFFPESIFK
jgi:thymidylate synthase (FAD)